MDAKDSNSSTARGSDKGTMNRSESELALEEFLRMATIAASDPSSENLLKTDSGDPCFLTPTSATTETWEVARGNLTSPCGIEAPLWCQSLTTKHSNAQAPTSTITDSQSSVFVGSLMSVSKPKVGNKLGREVKSDGFLEQSDDDDDDGEIEPGLCEQSANPNSKHSRRKISNRESARRSRKRKQEHLAGLETQVKSLTGENETLLKQLANAAQQFRGANTNNWVLKSDVEALRAKVKLAEDMVARGSSNCNFSHLLQSLNLHPSLNFRSSVNGMASVSPSVTIHGDNNSSFSTSSTVTRQSSCTGVGNGDSGNSNQANGMMSECFSCVLDIWP